MTEKDIYKAISELPQDKRMSKAEMQDALSSLAEKGWIQEKRIGLKKVYTIKQQSHR